MRSGYEYQVRDALIKMGVDFDYEVDTFEYMSTVRGGVCSECGCRKVGKKRKYTPDFSVTRGDYSEVYIEAKGRFPSTDRSKMRDVRKSNPTLDIRILFQERSAKQKAEVVRWCEKFDFDYAFGTRPPEEWVL
jgi:hypothetical protein